MRGVRECRGVWPRRRTLYDIRRGLPVRAGCMQGADRGQASREGDVTRRMGLVALLVVAALGGALGGVHDAQAGVRQAMRVSVVQKVSPASAASRAMMAGHT